MRVLLVATRNPERCWMPLNLLMLAGYLEQNGVECDIADLNIGGRYDFPWYYDLIGLSVLTSTRWDAFDLAISVHKFCTNTKIVMGGPHATVMPEQCARYADVVIKGDGEGPLLDLCQGKPVVERVIPMDDLPFAAWHKIDLWAYPGKGFSKHDKRKANGIDIAKMPRVPLQASRSCMSHCRFCSSFWVQGKYRMRSPGLLVREMEHLYSKGMRSFFFVDDSWYLDKSKALEFCGEVVARKMHVAFRVQTRADVLDVDYCEALKEAGCYEVAIGVETGSDALLDTMNKKATAEISHIAIRNCRRLGLRVEALLINGNEGETDETIEETRKFLKRARPTSLSPTDEGLFLFPGTAVYHKAVKDGLVDPHVWETRVRVPIYKFSREQIKKWDRRLQTYRLWPAIRYWLRKVESWLR